MAFGHCCTRAPRAEARPLAAAGHTRRRRGPAAMPEWRRRLRTTDRRVEEVTAMEYVRLGRTGLQVSKLCLGTMTFGLQSDEATAFSILDRAAEGGVDFLDTADAYPLGGELDTKGRTEEILGRWLKGKRDRFIVATKCFGQTGPAPFDG